MPVTFVIASLFLGVSLACYDYPFKARLTWSRPDINHHGYSGIMPIFSCHLSHIGDPPLLPHQYVVVG